MQSALDPRRGGERLDLVRRAFAVERFTIAWMVIEFGVAIYAGIAAHSLALIAFSLDSLVEIGHAGVLMWRLRTELELGADFPEAVEERAARTGGWILAGLATYIGVSAVWELIHHGGAGFSVPGLAISVLSIPFMWILAREKYRLADALGSRALRGDATESVSCSYLSFVVIAALAAQALFGAWWIDGVASLAAVYFIAREAREGLTGETCCDDD
jgi:divalent metal cation (Fe/Co/Zn/Cd) transporter